MKDRGGLKAHDTRKEPGRLDRGLMILSALFTLALLAYVTWHAVTAPDGTPPTAEVVSMEPLPDGELLLRIRLVNAGSTGLLRAEVEIACGDPPPTIQFEQVPAGGVRYAHVTCPPGTVAPQVSVVSFIEA